MLILSARTLSEDRTRGFDVGADQYMMKPFELDELISRVKNLLRTHAQRLERERPAHRRKQIVKWQRVREFRYLRGADRRPVRAAHTIGDEAVTVFLDNEGRVIPRAELLEQVWDLPGTTNTRAPDQFLRRLRKLFEVDPAKPRRFLTIRDVGYQFVGD